MDLRGWVSLHWLGNAQRDLRLLSRERTKVVRNERVKRFTKPGGTAGAMQSFCPSVMLGQEFFYIVCTHWFAC